MKNSNRKFGIEIEAIGNSNSLRSIATALTEASLPTSFEGYTHRTMNTWKVVTDVSVHGNNAFELVSPPMKGQSGLDQIAIACAVLEQIGVTVNRSCGVHVHHDGSDLRAKHLERIVAIYTNSETHIDSVMAPSRRGDNQWAKSIIGKSVSTLSSDRYHKVNLASMHRHGTVEFRQHGGSIDASKISQWVLLTQLIVERSKKTVKAAGSHKLSWYDFKQQVGLVHMAKTSIWAANTQAFFDNRKLALAA